MQIDKYKLIYRSFITVFWVMSCWGFVSEELLPPIDVLRGPVMAACDAVLIVIGLSVLRNRGDILVLLSYLALAFVSTVLLNHESVKDMLNGSRDFLGLLLVVPALRYFFTCDHAEEFKVAFFKQLKFWLYLQAFCITWQFVRHGAGDYGGGSMGLGASGLTSMLIYLVSYLLVTRNWDADHYFRSLRANAPYVLLLLPTFLNETKASFIFFILYFGLLMKFDRSMWIKMFYIVPVGLLALVVMGNIYLNVTNQDAEDVLSMEFMTEYLYADDLEWTIEAAQMVQDGDFDIDPDDWWMVDVPRFAKMALITPYIAERPGGMWLGAGVGHFKGGRMAEQTKFARDNNWILQGTRPWFFSVFVQLGLVGFIWFLIVLGRDMFQGPIYGPYAARMMFFLAFSIFFVIIYNESMRLANFCVMFFFMTFYLHYPPKEEPDAVQ